MSLFLYSCVAALFSFLFLIDSSRAQEKLSLQQAIGLALRQNPPLVIAQQEIAAAQGQVVRSGALPPTEIFSRLNEISFDFTEQDEFEVGLSQNIEFPGKRSGRQAVANAGRQIAELQLARLRVLLAAAVKKRYYEILLANENLASQQFAVQLLDDLQRLLTERYQSGAASYVDVVRSRIELGRGRSELAAVQQEQIAARSKLNLLLGRVGNFPLQLSDSLAYAPLILPRDTLFTQAQQQSNLSRIFATAVGRQRRVLQLAQLAGRPDFSLGASFQRVAENPPFTAAQPEGETVNAFGVEASISLPLFNRAAPKGEVQIAQAELNAVETRMAYFEQQLRRNFEVAFAAVAATEKKVLEFRDVVLPESQNALNAAVTAKNSLCFKPKISYLHLMFSKLSTSLFRTFGVFFVVCFTVSMFMCGDADCLTGNGDENCASLLCSLLNKHAATSQNAASGADKDCSCVCHVPTIIAPVYNFSYHPIAQYNTAIVILQISSTHNRLVYHPPTVA